MKKAFTTCMTILLAVAATAQEKGIFEVRDFGDFTLHAYYTNDVMNDASFVIEGKSGLVTLEEPLFKVNAAEFEAYLKQLGKPVEARIASYHLGGTGNLSLVMPAGMPEFVKGPVYGGMMKGFAQQFGDAIVNVSVDGATEVAFGSTPVYAGIRFSFVAGPSNDFPAASILIGDKVYYSHWAPAKAHVSSLQVSTADGVDAQIASLESASQSGADWFIGSHGKAADADTVRFMIAYLHTLKAALAANATATAFVSAMKQAYPGLPGEDSLEALGKALYK